MRRDRPKGKARLTTRDGRLLLLIRTLTRFSTYQVSRTPILPGTGQRAFRLLPTNGSASEPYDVHVDVIGYAQCTCADFIWCRDRYGEPCKHISALRAVGLLERGD